MDAPVSSLIAARSQGQRAFVLVIARVCEDCGAKRERAAMPELIAAATADTSWLRDYVMFVLPAHHSGLWRVS